MAFYARTFIFNGIPSEFYNIYLGTFGGSGEDTNATSSDVALLTQKIYRRPVPLFYGAEQTPVLQFPLAMYSPDRTLEVTAGSFSEVATWLFGQMAYKQLRLCQNDMQEIYFNCFLTAPQITRVGNIIRGMSATVVCDAPWAWKEPISLTRTYDPDAYSVYDSFSIDNESANNFYTFPTNLVIHANIFGGSVTITNIGDNNRQFILTLLPNEIVTINCDLQTVSSNLVTYPLGGFNKNFLRFIQGTNDINITGNIKSLSLTYPVAVKIGG
jgi:phage-related protein